MPFKMIKSAHFSLIPLFIPLLALTDTCRAGQDNTLFVGAGYSYVSNKNIAEDMTDKDKLGLSNIELVLGYQYHPLLGIDLRYGASVTERSAKAMAGETANQFDFKLDSYYSVYYRPEITNSEAKFYALIGYTDLTLGIDALDRNGALISETEFSESGTSYGLGMGWFVDDVNINLEYRVLLDKEEDEFSVITLSFDYRFHF